MEPQGGEFPGKVRVTFLGVTSLLIEDGQTCLLTDGFFSRPSLAHVALGRLAPQPERIARGLARAGIQRLDALLVGHSHYDHALDAPEVARRTGALLVGSASTANLARGWSLPDSRWLVAQPGEVLRFGAFRVRLLPSAHVQPNAAAGEIARPLALPARGWELKDGGCFTIHVEHPGGSLLVQTSAGFIPGALDEVRADAAFLALGMLGSHSESYRRAYFDALAGVTGARVVYPLHHDDFFRPLEEPLRRMPPWLDNVDRALRSLQNWAAEHGVAYRELPPWRATPLW